MVRVSRAVESLRSSPATRLVVTRRVVLALPALAIAACASDPASPELPQAAINEGSALSSAANEAELIAQYDGYIAQFPQLAATLSPLRDQHRAHLLALGGPAEAIATAAAATQVASAQAAVAQLAEAEKLAAQRRLTDCVATTDESVARILTLIAASEASHVAVLVGT